MTTKQPPPIAKREFVPLDLVEVLAAEPPVLNFVLPGLLAGTVGGVVAAGGTGKSVAMLTTALGIAIGDDIGKLWDHTLERGRAVYLSLEDPEVVLRTRLHSLVSRLSLAERDLAAANLQVLSYAGEDVFLASFRDGSVATTGWFAALAELLEKEPRPRICVVDTFNRALRGISENDSDAMGSVIAKLERLARLYNCAIVVCHHVSKQALTNANAGEAHAARGSSAITDNARWQCNLWVPSPDDQGFRNMSELECQAFVNLAVTKVNYGKAVERRVLRRGADGSLDFHGVLPSRAPKPGLKPRLNAANANLPASEADPPKTIVIKPAKPKARSNANRSDPEIRLGRRDPIEELKSA